MTENNRVTSLDRIVAKSTIQGAGVSFSVGCFGAVLDEITGLKLYSNPSMNLMLFMPILTAQYINLGKNEETKNLIPELKWSIVFVYASADLGSAAAGYMLTSSLLSYVKTNC